MITKFHFIELLRFISSIVVIIKHYHLFFYPRYSYSKIIILENLSLQPFYSILEFAYLHGSYAVPVFWGISGFIFALVYLEQKKNVSSKEFFINRFSRLYPLHLITLLFVAIAQLINSYILGSHQILVNNNLSNFILQIFFISGWFNQSFNLPIWSVSVEIMIYFAFFYSINMLDKFKLKYAFAIYISFLLIDKFLLQSVFVECFILFFSGVIVYYANLLIKDKKKLITLSFFFVIISFVGNFKINIFTPGIILFFISMEYLIKSEKKKMLDFFGNLTYSMYLLHIPTMLVIILIFFNFNLNDQIFLNNYFFIFYILIIIIISCFTFYFFEKPLNNYIRKKILNT